MVSLAESADVKGNIFCGRIVMEDGARFKGKIDMGDAPKLAAMPKETEQAESVSTKKPRLVAGQSANANKY